MLVARISRSAHDEDLAPSDRGELSGERVVDGETEAKRSEDVRFLESHDDLLRDDLNGPVRRAVESGLGEVPPP